LDELLPRFISLAGPSCSGKSSLARWLLEALGPAQSVILPVDAYYRNRDKQGHGNFDRPDAVESLRLFEDLATLAEGRSIAAPVYDFTTHRRLERSVTIKPVDWIVVEGLFALYWAPLRRMAAARVFIEAPASVCLERRVLRDTRERGRSPESVRRQFRETVLPMAERHVLPTRGFADLVVSGEEPVAVGGERVLKHLRALSEGGGHRRPSI